MGTRIIHSRRDGASSSRVCGLQDGTGAEATTTATFADVTPTVLLVGFGPQNTNPAALTFRALIVLDGTITGTQRTTINTWGAAHHGATV